LGSKEGLFIPFGTPSQVFGEKDLFVIPAKAGIYSDTYKNWIPAFAGMTG
jgi:hypothetical protein